MGHPCAIPNCAKPAKDGQLMCWPHWRRVPKQLNRAIFHTYANGPRADYVANVKEAVRVIQDKESQQGADDRRGGYASSSPSLSEQGAQR